MLERERLFAEQLAAPACQRGNVGGIVGGDALEIVDRGDHLGGDVMAFGYHAQQHFEQLDDSRAVGWWRQARRAR